MGILDFLTDSGLDPDTDRLVTGVLKRYGQSQMVGAAGNSLISRLSGKHAMDDENERLDIALKRRALGLPEDSEQFDESRNDETPIYAAGFNGLLQRIPEPGFLSPKMGGRGKTLLRTAIISGENHVVPGIIGRLTRALG